MKNLTKKGIDIMKKTKDTMGNQLSDAEMRAVLLACKSLGVTHVFISCVADTQAQVLAEGSTTPSPRTVEDHVRSWCDAIHDVGLLGGHRPAFCGLEKEGSNGLFGFPYYEYGSAYQLNIGTSSSAPTDGETTLCGRVRRYILTNIGASRWRDGEVFAPMPEGTTHAFDGFEWWNPASSQANYKDAYTQMRATALQAFSEIGVDVEFQTHNNFSEVRSAWIPGSHFTELGRVDFDYYGQNQGSQRSKVSDYRDDLNAVYSLYSKPMGFGEWGDIGGEAIPTNECKIIEDRLAFLINYYQMLTDDFVNTGKLTMFNYWGGWEDQNTSLFIKTGSGASSVYSLNARGKILQSFFNGHILKRVPVITSGSSIADYTF